MLFERVSESGVRSKARLLVSRASSRGDEATEGITSVTPFQSAQWDVEEAGCPLRAVRATACQNMRSEEPTMNHPMHRTDRRRGHRPVRTVVWLAGAVLLFGSAASAQRLDKDPVERFRQALIVETDKGVGYSNVLKGQSLEKAVRFRRANLTKAADNLVSLSELSRALLLVDWPAINADLPIEPEKGDAKKDKDDEIGKKLDNFDAESRKIVTEIRAKMAGRFNKGVLNILRNPGASDAAKIAVANLVGETVVKASDQGEVRPADEKRGPGKIDAGPAKLRLVSDIDIKAFADQLSQQTNEANERVLVAVAGALGQFRENPKLVGPALKRLLASNHTEPTRLAAAAALLNLSASISNKVSVKGSEPGVTPAEPRRFRRELEPEDILDLFKQLSDAASAGLGDSSVTVRLQCITAMKNIASEVTSAIRSPLSERPLPPRERADLSAEEIEAIKAERLALNRALSPVISSLDDYGKNHTTALGGAIRDADETVRIEARKTLRELARIKQTIQDLRDAIPEDKSKPKADDLSRRGSSKAGRIRLVGGTNPDKPSVLPTITTLPALRKLKQAPAVKAEGITGLLNEIGAGLITDGLRDPSAKVRRAAHEAIEAFGYDAVEYAPQLAVSLDDKDVFVRWISARILRKIAEEDERRERPHRFTEEVIPALVKGLADDDLDGRMAMTRALGAYGPAANSAVPALSALLAKGDAEYRVLVMKALEGIGEASQSALPRIAAGFEDPDPRIRAEAARLVGQLNKFSSSYLEALEKLTGDPDPKVREAAGGAVLRIQPK